MSQCAKFEETKPKREFLRLLCPSQCLAEDAGNDSDAEDDEFKMESPKFYALYSAEEQTWSTNHGNYVFNNEVTYPDLMKWSGSCTINTRIPWVKKLMNEARVLGYKRVDFSGACDVPSSNHGCNDTFHCQPNHHPYPYMDRPWFDWPLSSGP
jgi:hypothetical protein